MAILMATYIAACIGGEATRRVKEPHRRRCGRVPRRSFALRYVAPATVDRLQQRRGDNVGAIIPPDGPLGHGCRATPRGPTSATRLSAGRIDLTPSNGAPNGGRHAVTAVYRAVLQAGSGPATCVGDGWGVMSERRGQRHGASRLKGAASNSSRDGPQLPRSVARSADRRPAACERCRVQYGQHYNQQSAIMRARLVPDDNLDCS